MAGTQQYETHGKTAFDVAVCLSGGLDSCVSLCRCISEGMKCACIHFDLGLGGSSRSALAARQISERYNVPLEVVVIRVTHSLPCHKIQSPSFGTILYLLHASAFAYSIRCKSVALGLTRNEMEAFRVDAQWQHANTLLDVDVNGSPPLARLFPVSNCSKAEVRQLAAEFSIPSSLTWSCLSSSTHACGCCSACISQTEDITTGVR